MSYALSAALQKAVYQRLSESAALQGLVGAAIFDALPSGTLPTTYVSLGPEEVTDDSDSSGFGAVHRFVVSVVTTTAGFASAKTIGAVISDALVAPNLNLETGRLVSLGFETARAERIEDASVRRIDLTFRARVEA